MKNIDNILLIDDDFATNYIHKKLIANVNKNIKIHVAHSGLDAIQLLIENSDGEKLKPDLILLDINMPTMNGWEFLEEYEKLNYDWITDCALFMVSTSINPEDVTMSQTHPRVKKFINKPLKKETILEIFEN